MVPPACFLRPDEAGSAAFRCVNQLLGGYGLAVLCDGDHIGACRVDLVEVVLTFGFRGLGQMPELVADWIDRAVYVASNFSKQAVDECVSRYPAYYQFEEDDNEVIKSGEKYPDLDFFNAIYSESVSRYISRITQKYLDKIKK